MRPSSRRTLYWAPRTLAILFALFLSLFALDGFEPGSSFGEIAVALGTHLVPVALFVALLVVAWRREWVGALGFTALACLYVAWAWGRFPVLTYVLMSGPLLLLGVLFHFNWIRRAELRAR